ncbi:type 1 glutamine amidotransferase domain-containing protein [Opitutales bacterium ASA1]|uniref:type 1 glutamine amidotransferase domain-containing protein n=1 Tax=Congregicoccus parvus TaxID=3081749 RepID=UPI002B310A69|nr:type 1 glutamine amidotransferase domain-containing protein [Opitutales bacterium ASA1]
MTTPLKDIRVAVLATDGFEQSELLEPRRALREAGAETSVVSLRSGSIRGWKHDEKGDSVDVDLTVAEADASTFDALLLPGGVMNPDQLRQDEDAVRFVREFFRAGKPVAAICHGPQLLVEADVVEGRKLTSYASIRTDLINAGAEWVDQAVVCDQGLVTSRTPEDIPAFNAKMIEEFAEGVHSGQHA